MKQKKERKTQNQMFMFFLHPVPFIHLGCYVVRSKYKKKITKKQKTKLHQKGTKTENREEVNKKHTKKV